MTIFLLLSRSKVQLGDALIEDDAEEAHHGRAGQQERNEDEGRAGIERRESEERRDDKQTEQHRRRHTAGIPPCARYCGNQESLCSPYACKGG